MAREMIVALNIIFGLFILMIIRQIWLLIKEKKERMTISKGGMRKYEKALMTMSIEERMKRKKIPFRW